MRRWVIVLAWVTSIVAIAVGIAGPVRSQTWDPTKPAPSPAIALTADVRSNWNSLAQSLGGVNLLADPTFLIWAAGDAAAPSHYTLSGTGAVIARAGTGLGDTNRKVGDFCAKVTSGAGALATLEQRLLPTAAFSKADFLKGQTVSVGSWARCGAANACRVGIFDGVGTSYTAFAPNGAWGWVTATRTIDASATTLAVRFEVNSGTIAGYLSGPTFVMGPVQPQYYQPAPQRYENVVIFLSGTQTTGTDKQRHFLPRPAIVKDVQLVIQTAPTGQALIVDVNTLDGAFTSMFSTRPQIAAGAFAGDARPDTTYQRRCMNGLVNSSAIAGTELSVDVDQVGSVIAGSNLWIVVRYLTYGRPLEEFLAHDSQN